MSLTAEYTHHHPGFTCTAYLMADAQGGLAIHCVTRGSIVYCKSSPKPTTAGKALSDLRMWAEAAPLL